MIYNWNKIFLLFSATFRYGLKSVHLTRGFFFTFTCQLNDFNLEFFATKLKQTWRKNKNVRKLVFFEKKIKWENNFKMLFDENLRFYEKNIENFENREKM